MMRLLLSILLFYTCISGCAVHYYKINAEDVTLVLKRPEAKEVILFCSLNEFKPRPATNHSGRWVVELPSNKTFRYFYRVDDQLYIPDCTIKEKDDFGAENCIFDPHL